MNKRQKMQLVVGILFAILFFFWLFRPGWDYLKILGMLGNALGVLSMVLSFRAEEKLKK